MLPVNNTEKSFEKISVDILRTPNHLPIKTKSIGIEIFKNRILQWEMGMEKGIIREWLKKNWEIFMS